ncbi:uroporphyrinogen-III C-methyltransferase [Paenibacillus rhizovicinus]|uniref:Uroporphyrinogen-III C-methyltransferase n=1 Tax=Paenibacillus rhizovicinus TaxID=2704463 RepID=A0A6C0P2I0_9BACL|nr:uroporphyrinogen-III C-methyltransferase [Paenibacillus rhizovicinus]QHW32476.1 uroporphyrinogen-III C-methyltransferase [Paenibacillus rhizovicinus]
MSRSGKVYLTGAGPGDPKLITVGGLESIRRADVIIYDRLVSEALLKEARKDAELLYVGKASGHHTMKQDEINALIAAHAQRGLTVTRLKGGDPFVFGRGGEEAAYLSERGIPFEIIPGISSCIAAPAYAGIPVTQRQLAASFAVITGHECADKDGACVDWAWAAGAETLVILMGLQQLPEIVEQLLGNGKPPATPIALIQNGTWEEQRVVVGTLKTIMSMPETAQLRSPAAIVIGPVVGMRDKLQWRPVEALLQN